MLTIPPLHPADMPPAHSAWRGHLSTWLWGPAQLCRSRLDHLRQAPAPPEPLLCHLENGYVTPASQDNLRINQDHGCEAAGTVQFSSVAQLCPTLCDPMNRSIPGLPVHHQLPKFTQTHIHRVRDAIQPSYPLLSPSPPAPNPSQRVFSNESTVHMRWPKYWNFSFSIIPSKEIPGLNSFRMDWLDLLAVQVTLKSLL